VKKIKDWVRGTLFFRGKCVVGGPTFLEVPHSLRIVCESSKVGFVWGKSDFGWRKTIKKKRLRLKWPKPVCISDGKGHPHRTLPVFISFCGDLPKHDLPFFSAVDSGWVFPNGLSSRAKKLKQKRVK